MRSPPSAARRHAIAVAVVPRVLPILALLASSAGCDREPAAADRARRAVEEPVVAGQVPPLFVADVYAPPPRPLSGIMQRADVGAQLHGELAMGDTSLPENGGALCDEYVVQLTAGQPVTIFARGGPSRSQPGGTLDMYLYLRLHGRELMRDDDSASNGVALDSRIQYVPAETGFYVIRVSTYGSTPREGQYWLQVLPGIVDQPPPVPATVPDAGTFAPI